MKDYTHLQKKSKHKCTPTFSECAPIKCLIRNAKLLWEVYTKPLNKIGTTIYIYNLLKADKQWKWTKEATASQLLVHFDPDKKLICHVMPHHMA